MSLETLLSRPDVWRGRGIPPAVRKGIPTGFTELDDLLPGGGWPAHALAEILADSDGIGALRLVMPALVRLSRKPRWLAWIAPPHIPYAPALAGMGVDLSRVLIVRPRATTDGLWALEQALRSGTCSAVLAWPAGIDGKALRRLQLAAETGQSTGFLFCPPHLAQQSSPAALRLRLRSAGDGVDIHILKRRGGWNAGSVHMRFPPYINA